MLKTGPLLAGFKHCLHTKLNAKFLTLLTFSFFYLGIKLILEEILEFTHSIWVIKKIDPSLLMIFGQLENFIWGFVIPHPDIVSKPAKS